MKETNKKAVATTSTVSMFQPIKDINIRRIGRPVRLSTEETAALIRQLPEKYKEYPVVSSAAYRLGEFRVLFPLPKAPRGLASYSWGVVTDASTGNPLALVPGVWAGIMEDLRKYFRIASPFPIVILHNDTVYWDEPKYSYDVGLGWIPLTADNEEEN